MVLPSGLLCVAASTAVPGALDPLGYDGRVPVELCREVLHLAQECRQCLVEVEQRRGQLEATETQMTLSMAARQDLTSSMER